MSNSDNILRLVVADESLNDAEQVISVLRNAGLAVRPTRVEDEETLQAILAEQPQDLCLCALGLPDLPLDAALRVLHQSGTDVPVLVLAEQSDQELRRDALRLGAFDLVSKDDTEHLQYAVRRELGNLQERRRMRRLEAALRESERRCQTLLDSSRDAIAYIHEGMHVYANASYLERFGFERFDELEGLPILDLVRDDDQSRVKRFLRDYTNGARDTDRIEVAARNDPADGAPIAMEFSEASWDGEPCTQLLIRQQAASTDADIEERLAILSRQDTLTGLYNRRHFIEQLDQRIAEAVTVEDTTHQSGLLYIEPDNLDAVRQNLGITAVDLIIGDIATIVKDAIGTDDVASRFADGVLTVLLPGQGVHEALAVAEAIRGNTEQHVSETGNRTITKSCSIGVAVIGDGVASAHQAIDLAYAACDVARREGGDRVHLHAAGEENGTQHGSNWKRVLSDALEDDNFYLVYQPLVSLAGDQRERFDARLRLSGEHGEEIRPSEFLTHAEQYGMSAELDLWVVREAVQRLMQRERDGHETTLFIKITGATLSEQRFLDTLAELLRDTGVPGARLVFELNEPVAVTQLNQAKAFYRAIKELRCGFALDQFGTGHNPFQLAKHLPADYLKIDRTLTRDLSGSEANQEILRSIIENAHEMRKKVIASYLEEATVLAMLWQYQVDLVQGHFLGEPHQSMDYDFTGMVI